jgi:DUF1365 family protein
MIIPAFAVITHMRARPTRHLLAYGVVIALIAFSFGWQMLHGICPVP